jgi:hypothetical protein
MGCVTLITLYKYLMLSVLLCGCEHSSLILGKEDKLETSENMTPGIFGHKREKVTKIREKII